MSLNPLRRIGNVTSRIGTEARIFYYSLPSYAIKAARAYHKSTPVRAGIYGVSAVAASFGFDPLNELVRNLFDNEGTNSVVMAGTAYADGGSEVYVPDVEVQTPEISDTYLKVGGTQNVSEVATIGSNIPDTYTVRHGDNLWGIVKQYRPDLSDPEIGDVVNKISGEHLKKYPHFSIDDKAVAGGRFEMIEGKSRYVGGTLANMPDGIRGDRLYSGDEISLAVLKTYKLPSAPSAVAPEVPVTSQPTLPAQPSAGETPAASPTVAPSQIAPEATPTPYTSALPRILGGGSILAGAGALAYLLRNRFRGRSDPDGDGGDRNGGGAAPQPEEAQETVAVRLDRIMRWYCEGYASQPEGTGQGSAISYPSVVSSAIEMYNNSRRSLKRIGQDLGIADIYGVLKSAVNNGGKYELKRFDRQLADDLGYTNILRGLLENRGTKSISSIQKEFEKRTGMHISETTLRRLQLEEQNIIKLDGEFKVA